MNPRVKFIRKATGEKNFLDEIRNTKRQINRMETAEGLDSGLQEASGIVSFDSSSFDYFGYDENGILRVVISGKDLFDTYGVHAHIVGLSEKSVVQFYVSADDGKIYGAITMDEIRLLIDALVTAQGEERFFRVGTRNNGTAPEGVVEFGEQSAPLSIANADYDNGLDDWHVLSPAYTKQVINTSLPTKIINCMTMDADGNIYVGLTDSGSPATSAVWKLPVGTTTWEALGTLNTGFNILAIACDSHGNVFVGGDDLTTSRVWKWNGSTWAAHGTLSTFFTVRSLLVDSNDRLYAGTTNGTTSRVWYVDDGSTTWAALGTLTGLAVYAMVKDASDNIYAVGDGSATSSAWWWNGSAWAALGTLNISNSYLAVDIDPTTGYLYAVGSQDLVYWNGSTWTQINDSMFYLSLASSEGWSIAFINDSILVGRVTSNTSPEDEYGALIAFDVTGNLKKIDFDFTSPNEIRAILKSGNNFYVAGGANVDVALYTLTDSWNADDEYAEITTQGTDAAIVLGTRFAVTAGNLLQVKLANYLEAVGGIANARVDVEFWNASTGGTLVSTSIIVNRAIDDDTGALSELSNIVSVPTGATYAVIVAYVTLDTATEATVRFDDFEVLTVDNFVRLTLNDDGLFAQKDARRFDLLNRSENLFTDKVVNIDTTGAETTLLDEPVEASWLLVSENFIKFSFHVRAQMTTSRSCTFRVYLGGTVILTWSKGGTSNIVELFDIDGKIIATGNNSQIVLATEKFMNVTGAASALSLHNATGAKDNTIENNLKITAQFSGALTSAVAYGVQVEKVNGVI